MRIRSIKPEFWRSPDVTGLAIEDRLLFIGLWSYVDDNGVGRDDMAALVGDLFADDMLASPRETVARVQRGLERFETKGLISRYTADGRRYLHITTWEKHQKIDRPSKPRYPGPDQAEQFHSTSTRESASSPRDTLDAGAGEQGAGEQGNREQFFDRSLALIDPVEDDITEAEAFTEWWAHVRRKVARPAAKTAYVKALRKVGGTRAEATRTLTAAIDEHQRHWFELAGRSIDKTPHPATWLNAESWNDELPADDAYQGRGNPSTAESPTEKIARMRAAAMQPVNGATPNGNEGRMYRPALGSRVS